MNPAYKPYEERVPDMQYLNLIRMIRNEGLYTKTRFQTNGTFSHFGLPPLVYNLRNGFPILTERSLRGSWAKYVNEGAAFLNGAVTLDQLLEYGGEKTKPDWWPLWINPAKSKTFNLPERHLGGASYGAILHDFPFPVWEADQNHPEGGRWVKKTFNQFSHLLQQMREMPDIRTHVATTWYPPGALQHEGLVRDVIVAPCHGTVMKFSIIDGKLIYNHVQRSWDGPLGGAGNIAQHCAIGQYMAHVLDLEFYQYIHYIMDGQIYEDQMDLVEAELLVREPRAFPTLRIKPDAPKDFFAIRAEHFELTDYEPHPPIRFPGTE